nr:hypothetical protein K-LCC10_0299 [Kaumoebavirus]
MENIIFDDEFTLEGFFKKQLPGLLHKEFPYLSFKIASGRLSVKHEKTPFILDVTAKDGRITNSDQNYWEVIKDTEEALRIFKDIVRREPSLAYIHVKHEMKCMEKRIDAKLEKIIELITYAPGGPGYEEAKADFEARV